MAQVQLILDPEHLKPSRSGAPIYCHEDFLTSMEANRANAVGKRASLLLQRLMLNERREFFKSTHGINKGWRRSRLGGNNGSHYYAWWAPKGASPLAQADGFGQAPEDAIFLRAIRHHDDHSPLDPQALDRCYVSLGAEELRDDSMVPAPWTPQQSRFARARQNVRTLRGFPGSGKTTALWHAAETAATGAVLYVTYSRDLAALAHDYFNKLVPAHKKARVFTCPELLRICAGAEEAPEGFRQARQRFLREIASMSPRLLGPWADTKAALYDEMHAHLIGSALPIAIGRWPASGRRVSPKDYRALRERNIGRSAVDAAIETADALDKRGDKPIEDRFFPELALARQAFERLRKSSGWLQDAGLSGFDCIAVDETQDLTPLEALLLIEIAAANRVESSSRITFLAAGDEAQTVRPTDFEWGWFHDLLYEKLGSPADFELRANLRSPQRIAEIVNRVWVLYGHISKQERPSGSSKAELEDESGDQVVFCTSSPGEELSELLAAFAAREGLALVNFAENPPDWVPEAVRPHLVSVSDIKGLDFHSVCVLNGGEFVQRVTNYSQLRTGSPVGDLSKRLAIDQLRVAVSRPAERLYWLEVNPTGAALKASRELLADSSWDLPMPVVPAVVLKALEEETLAVEERIRLCEADARQFLPIKPDIAWSRANQAVSLLGSMLNPAAVQDEALRRSAHLTMAEIAFCLAFRGKALSPQLGSPDLYGEAARHAHLAGSAALSEVLATIGAVQRSSGQDEAMSVFRIVRALDAGKHAIEPWLRLELQPHAQRWAAQIESFLDKGLLAYDAAKLLPGLHKLFDFPDAARKADKIRLRAAETLLDSKLPKLAFEILEMAPDCDPKLKARCVEGIGDLPAAAEMFLAAGSPADALRCYRMIPDFEKALGIAKELGDHPALDSLLWLSRMRDLAQSRPPEFRKTILPQETKLLEQVLEDALGATRKKPAVRKAAGPKATTKPKSSGAPAKRAWQKKA